MRCGVKQISSQTYKKWLEIKGNVKVDGYGRRKRLMVFDRLKNNFDIIYSKPDTGEFIWRADESVYKQNETRFLVIALDDKKMFNAEAADFITPAISFVKENVR